MKPPFVRSPYNYDRDAASAETGLHCPEQTLTQQQFAEDADINEIVRRFGLTGQLPESVMMPVNADFSETYTYHEAWNALCKARESFDAMPADIRYRFHNNPAEFVDWCSDDANYEEARKMGLLRPDATGPAPAETLPPGVGNERQGAPNPGKQAKQPKPKPTGQQLDLPADQE